LLLEFGGRDTQIFIAGRNFDSAKTASENLQRRYPAHKIEPVELDINSSNFSEILHRLKPKVLIHTVGPFDDAQGYRTAKICIANGIHYIDLADNRTFVTKIVDLNNDAMKKNTVVISGASTVPGISFPVVRHLMSNLDASKCDPHTVKFFINPGNKSLAGVSTLASVMSYCGKPFSRFVSSR
jgi:saccharopine dehydrogenase-like NADP-dependent oxidoreductase